MIRKNIQITEVQEEALRKLAFKTRLSESEHIRRALDLYLNQQKQEKEAQVND